MNIYSVKWSSRLATGLSFLKFLSLAFVVVLGVWHIINKSESLNLVYRNILINNLDIHVVAQNVSVQIIVDSFYGVSFRVFPVSGQ